MKTAGAPAEGAGGARTTAAAGPYVWKNAQVVGGGYVTGLVFNPREKGLLYARTDVGGAYRWDSGAQQWIPLTDWVGEKDWNLLGIDAVATGIDFAQSDPAVMVRVGRGGAQDGAYSTDGGSNWKGFSAEPVPSAQDGHVALSADGSTIVWTEAGQAPYRSTDRGASWSRGSGLGTDAVVVADRSSAGTFYSLSGGTLHASTDGGATFTARAGNRPSGRLTAVPGIGGDLWISGYGKGLLHSTDGGRTFETLTTVQSASALGFGKAKPGTGYQALYLIGTVKNVTGVFRSTDKGATWLRRRPRHLRPRLHRHQRTRPPVRRPVLTGAAVCAVSAR